MPPATASLHAKRNANRLLLLLCVLFILANSFLPFLLPQGQPALFQLLLSFLIEGLLVVPALLFIRKLGGAAAFGLTRPANKAQVLWAIGLGVAGFCMATGINSLMQALWTQLQVSTISSTEIAYMGGGWNMLASFLSIVLIPAIAEEVLFRGALLHAWLPQGRTRAVWRCALLFALLHMNPMSLPAYVALGLLFASVTVLSGSIVPAMLMHGLNNFIVFLISYSVSDEFVHEAEEFLAPSQYVFSGVFYLLLALLIGFFCYRGFRRAVAKAEAQRRLLYAHDDIESGNSVFLPPLPPEADAEADAGAAAPMNADSSAPLPAAAEAPPPTESPEAPPAQHSPLLMGTGRVSLLLAYLLLAAFNIFVFLVATGALGGM